MMYRYLLLCSVTLLFLVSCEENNITPCATGTASCVQVRNDTGVDLEQVRLRLNRGDDFTLLADLNSGETSDLLPFANADWCDYRLEALDGSLGVYVSGGWICAFPDPLGAGTFTIVLTPGEAIPAQYSVLDATLIR